MLCVARARIKELTAEHASSSSGTETAKAEGDTLNARIRELEVATATRDEELGVAVQVVRSRKSRVAAGEEREHNEWTRA